MTGLQTIISILDSRSFNSIWYWLFLATIWSLATRHVLGVPPDLIHRALTEGQRADGPEEANPDRARLELLDWLSLTVPRAIAGRGEGVVLTGICSFLLVTLLLLGFRYGLEMAQALVLLFAPLALVAVLHQRLAHRLARLLDQARAGEVGAQDAARNAARQMRSHRRQITVLSVMAVILAAYFGALLLAGRLMGY